MQTITTFFKKLGMFLIAFLFLSSLILNAQIRIVEVDPINDTAIIKNFGGSTIDITNYWSCTLFVYNQLNSFTIVNGSLSLASGATVELSGLNLNDSDGDLDLYTTNVFSGPNNTMIDFMQWGDAGNGRESVANSEGIWTAGEFLAGSGPFFYNGNGTQNGASNWAQGTLSTSDQFLNSALAIYPNPVQETLNIKKLHNVRLKNIIFYDMIGRIITSRSLSGSFTGDISLKDLNSGIYTLKLSDIEGRTISRRFIKQ